MNSNKKTKKNTGYAARLEIDYPEKLHRGTTFFRLLCIIPIAIILGLITGSGETVTNTAFLNEAGEVMRTTRETAFTCRPENWWPTLAVRAIWRSL